MIVLVVVFIIGFCGGMLARVITRVNVPITFDFLFLGFLTGVVFFVDDLVSI